MSIQHRRGPTGQWERVMMDREAEREWRNSPERLRDRIGELENTIHDLRINMHTIRRDTLEEVLKICGERVEHWRGVYNSVEYRDNEHVRGLLDEAEAIVDYVRALMEKEL